jgi:hypothetical protein
MAKLTPFLAVRGRDKVEPRERRARQIDKRKVSMIVHTIAIGRFFK